MNEQFGTNFITWFIIFPVLIIATITIIWFIIKTHVNSWKRIGLSIAGLFTFIGFAFVLFGFYYKTNKTFSASFNVYAYSALSPKQDPFDIAEGQYGSVLATFDVCKENGLLKVLHTPKSSEYGSNIFNSGKWTAVKINDDIVTVSQNSNLEQDIIHPSLWWALTKNLYYFTDKTN